MAVSEARMLTIVSRCQNVGWKIESGGSKRVAWAYRITRPDGRRVQIHRTPSDSNWMKVVIDQLNDGGLLDDAEAALAERLKRERDEKLAADKAKNDAALAKAERNAAALHAAARPIGVREAEAAWLLTPAPLPETRTVIIRPEVAGKLLETINTCNRPKRENRTDEFVAIINDGEWGITHQGGAIDTNGVLQDGQHRLEAIYRSGKAQVMQMSVGMPPENFTKVDTPLVRRARDAAYMRGEHNVLTLTAAARLIIQFDRLGPNLHLRGSKTKVSIDAVDRVIRDMGDELRAAVARAHRIRREIKIPATTLAAAIYLIGRRLPVDDPRVERFFDDIETGANVEKFDPVWLLRRHFIRDMGGMGRPNQYAALAYIIKAWNLRAQRKTVQQLVWRSNEAFPANVYLPPPPAESEPEEEAA